MCRPWRCCWARPPTPPHCSRRCSMQSLRDVQRAIQLSLLRDEDGHAADHIVGGGLAPAQRLGIYRNTMLGTLANALRLTFPAVHRLVGADFFDGAAQIFA